jgi:hypothetical protein
MNVVVKCAAIFTRPSKACYSLQSTLLHRVAVASFPGTATRNAAFLTSNIAIEANEVSRLMHQVVTTRTFHHSSPVLFPVRRRRRGAVTTKRTEEDNDGDDDAEMSPGGGNTLRHTPVTDTVKFRMAAKNLFDKLEIALEPMKKKNEIFIITREEGDLGEIFKIDVGPKEGFYQIEVSEDEHVFEYSSPISGKILYCLSASTGEWVGVDDGNAFEGILGNSINDGWLRIVVFSFAAFVLIFFLCFFYSSRPDSK